MALSKLPTTIHPRGLSCAESVHRIAETSWSPNTDIYVTGEGMVITVELAGMRREDLALKAEGERLRITGQRPDQPRPSHCKFLLMEIDYGSFESWIEIPGAYDLKRAKAIYQNGFLRIEVPLSAARGTSEIKVDSLPDPG